MKNNRLTKKLYSPPIISTVEIEPSLMLAMSGQGTDTNNDYDFGGRGANERRGAWGNLWHE